MRPQYRPELSTPLRNLFLGFLLLFSARLAANCPQVVASFTTSQVNICGPGPVSISFTNTSTGANAGSATYIWYRNGNPFDNTSGLSAPNNNTISAVGTYTFMVIATDPSVPCTDSATVVVTIHPVPNASFTFSPNNQCAGLPVNFTNTSTGTTANTTYNWNFGDATSSTQQSPTHTYGAGGTFTVTLTVTNFAGCTSTFTQVVTALAIPLVSIAGDDGDGNTTNCLLPGDPTTSEIVTFSNFTTGATSYTWDFGDGSPLFTTASNASFTHTYSTYGTFTVTMTATGPNGCTATATLVVVFERYVGASFSVPIQQMSGCLPLTIQPVNASQNANTYTWNFGDLTPPVTTTSPVPPPHTYTTPGTYTITLTAANSCNTSQATVSPIVVVGPPNVNFIATPNPGCSPQVVSFTNQSTGVSPANSYQWNFGNGNVLSGTGNAPPQTYLQGTYTITLIASSACGQDTAIRVIVVDTIPDINLTVNPTNGCTPLVVTANNTSTGGALSYQWYVDNVYVSNTVNIPPQTFTAPAGNNPVTHSIHLYVSNHCGTRDSLVNITVHPAVVANFAPLNTTICQGGSVTFTQSSLGDQLTYQWNFGNGNTATTAGPHTQVYNVPGTHTVTLIVNGFCGADTITGTVVVNPTPVANIVPSVTSGCEDLAVSFTNNSTAGGTYSWNFGAGSSPTTSTAFTPPTVSYVNPGSPVVTFTVNVLGCIAYDTVTLTVLPRPIPVFSIVPVQGCTPLTVAFTNSTAATPGNIYTWDFGNGNTSSTQNPAGQTYIANLNDSVYTVELVVTGSNGCADSITHTVTVHPLPVAAFTMSNDTVCALDNIFFTNTSTGISTYQWAFGDAGTSTTTNPTHAYGSAGTYTVQLIATTAYGCRDTITDVVVVDSIPSVAFSATTECVGDSTSFTNSTTGNVVTWLWNFGDATSSAAQSPTHLYNTNGSYNVTLTATNNAGCSSFLTQAVTVNLVPTAQFSGTTACTGSATAFTDQTTGAPIGWTWDFGDGSPLGNTQNPSHIYPTAGTYTVTMIAAAGSGCADTITNVITVNPVPTAQFTFVSVCANDTTDFTNTSLGNPTTFTWDYGDGSPLDVSNNPNPSHVYNTSGNYNVVLTAGYATGCTNTTTVSVAANPRTTPSFTSNVPCFGLPTNFTDATGNTPNQWQWDFGDGSPLNTTQNPSHTYATPGTYSVTLTTQNSFGCVDSITTVVTVNPLPVADFAADTVCEGYNSSFTDLSTSATAWQWDFGDASPISAGQNPSHVYLIQGTYTVTLIVQNAVGCPDTIQYPVIVRPLPVAAFASSVACHTYPTQFTDNSVSAVAWEWDYGDGSPLVNQQSPFTTYANAGTYNATLVAFNIYGCSDTLTQPVTVLPQPQAGFANNTVCANSAVVFTDTSSGTPTQWSWDFGDGSPLSTNQNPPHNYLLGGTYPITLIVGNSAGCADTLVQNITVGTMPFPAFSATSVCLGNITAFTDLTTDPTPIGNYYWDFGDGNNSFQQNPNYIYQNPGTYTVTLTATNTSGCDSTITGTVTVTAAPIADFVYDTVCVGSATSFNDISTGSPSSWLWDFGDASTSSAGPSVQHTYSAAGTYLVSLIVSGGPGCMDQIFHVVNVVNTVQAVMNVSDSVCISSSLAFNDASITNNATISGWLWDFGDGSPLDTNQNTAHIYNVSGTYTVTLSVWASSGCVSITTQTITVSPLPVAAFAATTACENQQTQFTDNTSGAITQWQWDFGDATTSIQQNPSHQYAVSGNYNVQLIVTTAGGCSDTISNPVTVYAQPVAAFSADTVCWGDTTKFTNLSTSTSGAITSVFWDFGDGNQSTVAAPDHEFAVYNDSFQVTLIVMTQYGCYDTLTQLAVTYPVPDVQFAPAAASGCEDFTTTFTENSTINGSTIINWLWDFGDGNFTFTQNPTHTYDNSGSYYVGLTVTTSDGCVFSDSLNFPIVVYPKPVADFTWSPSQITVLQPQVEFTDLSFGATMWEYDFGDFDGSIMQNPAHTYQDSGWYTVTQMVVNQFGCSDTIEKPLRVEAEFTFFIPNAFTPNGNGNNEIFNGEGEGIREFTMYIFDRWGNLIFESHDPTKGWDGRHADGTLCQIDTYVYRFILRDVMGEEHKYMGHVNLIR